MGDKSMEILAEINLECSFLHMGRAGSFSFEPETAGEYHLVYLHQRVAHHAP